ncbi:hypothetical protein Pan97_42750 [Bremerella volcania]|uniref:Uncharacterized protein n=1 Tax=Bremerella volcania TaxID=2527984 RepID=A0A518CDB6_9BACT|nr:hypothetical protein [Bremerella volcania]QDU77213.1 hypothetical protein Pan97_42750 [Bremerella volcania]
MSHEDSGRVISPRKWNFAMARRIVLLTIFLFVMILACSPRALFFLLDRAEWAGRELGMLDSREQEMIHVASVPQSEDLSWEWRVILPPGRVYQLNVQRDDIDPNSLPYIAWPDRTLPPGEALISVSYEPIIDDGQVTGQWTQRLRVRHLPGTKYFPPSESAQFIPVKKMTWTRADGLRKTEGMPQNRIEQGFDASRPVVLLRTYDHASALANQQYDGVLVWLTPKQKP